MGWSASAAGLQDAEGEAEAETDPMESDSRGEEKGDGSADAGFGPAAASVPFGGRLPPAESKSIHDDEVDDVKADDKGQGMAQPRSAYDDYEPTLPRGVTYNRDDNSYSSGMRVNGKFLNLGTYDSPEEAAEAYRRGQDKYKRK